jgi:hypothetical protein
VIKVFGHVKDRADAKGSCVFSDLYIFTRSCNEGLIVDVRQAVVLVQ